MSPQSKYLIMPALTGTMTEGKLARWLKSAGDRIKKGEVVAEVETDKAVMELEAEEDGAIDSILVPEGTDAVAVNQPLATIIPDGPVIESPRSFKSERPDSNIDFEVSALSPPRALASQTGRVHASPLVKRLAAEAGIDLKQIIGSGPNGRIIEADILGPMLIGKPEGSAVSAGTSRPIPASSQSARMPAVSDQLDLHRPYTAVAHSPMRKSIARRLTESASTIPHFSLSIDCRADRLIGLRERVNRSLADGRKFSLNDFVIRAAALALRSVPGVNSRWLDNETRWYEEIDIAVAVATSEGLITPVIRNADRKNLSDISQEMRDLAQRARQRTLKPAEFEGGTFSISNLGMHGIGSFVAIINPPQAAILAVGAVEKRAVVENGALVVGSLMTCTLSCDHRLIDGALGASFLQTFRKLIEDPSPAVI